MARTRRHMSFANVTSLLALVFAMGGAGYAATLPRNSVGSAQIKPNAVTGSDIRAKAVTSSDVADRSLRAVDFAAGQLPAGLKGDPGTAGAPGAKGDQGLQGIQGVPGVVGAITVMRADFSVADNASATGFQIDCPTGTRVIGGGTSIDATSAADVNLTVSRPFRSAGGADGTNPVTGETFDAWRVTWSNPVGGTGATPGHVWAICVQT